VLCIATRGGANIRVLAEGRSADWSPDGRRIVFARDDGIWLIDVDGSGQRRLPITPGADEPRWSPDGRRIAFGGVDDTLQVLDLASGKETVVEHSLTVDPAGGIAWSPDGQDLAYVTVREAVDGPSTEAVDDVLVRPVSGGRRVTLLRGAVEVDGLAWRAPRRR
jgi:Tol biopolymer transport system component